MHLIQVRAEGLQTSVGCTPKRCMCSEAMNWLHQNPSKWQECGREFRSLGLKSRDLWEGISQKPLTDPY